MAKKKKLKAAKGRVFVKAQKGRFCSTSEKTIGEEFVEVKDSIEIRRLILDGSLLENTPETEKEG